MADGQRFSLGQRVMMFRGERLMSDLSASRSHWVTRLQRPYTRTLKFPGLGVGNGRGCFSVGAAGGLKSDVLRKTRWVLVSTWQVLAPYSVFSVSTSLSLSGESS